MSKAIFSSLESRCASEGAMKGLDYLESIGKTDLALLSPDEYFEYARSIIGGYRIALGNDMAEAAPF